VDGHVLGVQAGDRLQVFALFSQPPRPLNPGDFDVAWYRRCERQLVRLEGRFPDAIRVLATGSFWNWRRALGLLRDPCHDMLWSYLRERQAGLASALLLGGREHMDWERTEAFVTTGTVHLLAISGVHVGILAYGFWWVARLLALRRRLAIGSAIAFVTVYALLTDAGPPVIRAAILVVAFCLARLSARRSSGFNALAASGVAILAWNPTAMFQTGAQFSFLAVAAIYLWGPYLVTSSTHDPLERLIEQSRPWFVRWGRRGSDSVRKMVVISAAVWLVTLPLTALRYHLVSPIALVLNPVVWLPVTVALFSGFLVLVFGWLVPPLGQVCGGVCNLSLALLEWLVDGADKIAAGHFWTPAPALWWVVGAYVGLGLYAVFLRRRLPLRWSITAAALWLGLGAVTTVRQLPFLAAGTDSLVCTFLAVGHGDCAVVELPPGQTLLYDAGAMGAPESTARTIAEFLWTRRITHLDAVVVSHADADHYNAIPELLKRFSVGAVYVSPLMFENRTEALTALRDALTERGIPVHESWRGDRLRVRGATRLSVLHPPRRGMAGGDNANSLTLQLDHGGRRILLTGDLEPPGLDDLLAGGPSACDAVLAPHHGSLRSDPAGFFAWCRPEWVIVSAAANEGAAASAAASISPPRRVVNTGLAGAVQTTIDGGRVEVRTWRSRPW
jgi:competence protein ComEC